MFPDHDERIARAEVALEGLSVGDAFGERFFLDPSVAIGLVYERAEPTGTLLYTDDTAMALGIVTVLREHGRIRRDALAAEFARRYRRSPDRGYGATAHDILRAIGGGEPWQEAAARPFGGAGSMGNGGAMRVAPLGAFHALDEPSVIVAEARRSAEVTHMHPDGQAGAIAVALAAAFETKRRVQGRAAAPAEDLFAYVLLHTPHGPTRDGIERADYLRTTGASVVHAAEVLGSGSRVIASDTVPFALFCAAQSLGRYADAIWTTLEGLGDRDTTCAIVGGIVASGTGIDGIPADWRARREPLGELP